MSDTAQAPQSATAENPWPEEWPVWAPAVLAYLSKSPNVYRAAEAAQIDRKQVYRLRDRDERFGRAMLEARDQSIALLEETVYAQATTGLPVRKTVTKTDKEGNVLEVTETEEVVRSATLAMFFLKRWRPEYRESYRVEQTGIVAVQHDVTVRVESIVQDLYNALDEIVPPPHLALPPGPPAEGDPGD